MMRYLQTTIILLSVICSGTLTAQYLVNNGADIYISQETTLNIQGNFTNLSNGNISNSGKIKISGDWINDASEGQLLHGDGGEVVLNGSSMQTIGGQSRTWFHSLTLQQQAQLLAPVSVDSILELDNVNLLLNQSSLYLGQPAQIVGAGPSSYLITNAEGKVYRNAGTEAIEYPVGTTDSYVPAMITSSAGDEVGLRVFQDVRDGGVTGLTIPEIGHAVNLTWEVEPGNNAGNYDLQVNWNASDEGTDFNRGQSGIGHFAEGSWQPAIASSASGDGPYSQYLTGITGGGAFAVGDADSPLAYIISLVDQQIIITEGWSGISTYVDPIDPDVETMFQPVIDELIILQDDVAAYWPGENMNTIGNWNTFDGYKIKVAGEVSLTVTGNLLENASIELDQGWNLIPVLSQSALDVVSLFDGIDIALVKQVAGTGIYWPQFGINTLEAIQPGKSYFVYANNPATLDFIGQNVKSNALPQITETIESPWNPVSRSAGSHVIAFKPELLSELLPGEMIGVFTTEGICAGLAVYENTGLSITVFSDDPLTPEKDGFTNGEAFNFKLYRPGESELVQPVVTFDSEWDDSGEFHENGMSVAKSLKISGMGISGNDLTGIQMFPNPTNGMIYMKGVPEEARIEVRNGIGEMVRYVPKSSLNQIDLSGNSPGIYFIKISTNNRTSTHRFVLK